MAINLDIDHIDPITGAKISHDCWNNHHVGQNKYLPLCNGWRETSDRKTKRCGCYCHDPQDPQPPKVSRRAQQAQTMDIMDSGCGTIEVK